MTMAVNTIANGGIWVPPRLIKGVHAKHVEDSTQYAKDLRQHLRQPAPHRVYRAETAQAMTRLLTQALDNNKTHPAYLGFMRVAGKTGTAKKARGGGYANGGLVTSFSGYFPAESPEIMMMVVVDSPKMAESWGSTVAAPIFRRVALESIHYLNLAPKTSIKVAPLPAVSSTSTPKPTPERVTPEPLMNTQTHAPRAVEASTAKPLRASVKVPG
jgi:cell division protein FtsI/penicillin-binding protein 2